MVLSAFDDKSKKPRASDLAKVLSRAHVHWDSLTAHIAAEFAPLDMTWSFFGAKWGWALRLRRKKRTVLYMTPCKGHFVVGFSLGEKAVKAAHASPLPKAVLEVIDGAKKYAEGRAVRIDVKSKKDLESVKKLAAIKMAN